MTHHRYNRSARFQIFLIILFLYDGLRHFCAYIFCLEAEFLSHQVDGLGIQTLVDGYHHTNAHTSGDDLSNRNIHHACQLVGRHEFRNLQYLAFCHFHVFQFLHTAGSHVTFLLTILGTFVLSFGSEACQSFLYLLCYIFLANLLLDDRLLEAVLIAVAVIIGIVSTRLVSTLRAGTLTLLGTCVSTVVATTLEVGSIVDVHFLLIDTDTFLLTVGIAGSGILQLAVITADFLDDSFLHLLLLILANLFLLFTLLAFLLFRFLLRACGLVQGSQVYLSDDINLRNKLRLMYLEDFLSFFFPLFLNRCFFSHRRGSRRFYHFFLFRFLLSLYNRSRLFLDNGLGLRLRNGLRLGLRCRLYLRLRLWLRLGSRSRFRFRCFHNYRLLHLLLLYHFLRFFLLFLSRSRSTVQFVQINLAYRLELRTCVFRNNRLNLLGLRFLLRFLIAVNRHGRLVAVLALTFLAETLRLYLKVLICTKLLFKQFELFIRNFRVRICLNGKSLLLQELDSRRNSYI